MYKYFKEEEFTRCSPPCKLSDMDKDFMHRLDIARDFAGVPFVINSAYRSSEWDKNKGRSGKGMHTLGRAVDIRCGDTKLRAKILSALVIAGFHGIGIATSFIHVDNRKIPNIWLY